MSAPVNGHARAGRRAGIALFWLMLAYMIGMSSLSIIPSLYFPALGPRPAAPGLERCASELAALDQALLQHVTSRLHGGMSAASASLTAWDARFLSLQDCGPLDSARQDLSELRNALEAMIRSYERGPKHTRERIHRALTSLSRQEPERARPES